MGWYSKLLAGVTPDYQVRRLKAKTLTAAYETTQSTRTFKRRAEKRGPNASNKGIPRNMREQIRHLEQNLDLVAGALDVLVANVVGNGIVPEPQVMLEDGTPAQELNDQITTLWRDWSKKGEVTWTCDEAHAQRLACRTWMRDGEVLLQHILGNRARLTHGNEQIPYSYEMIEPDLLPGEHDLYGQEIKPRNAGNQVIAGIELNAWNRPIWYHVYKLHPGETEMRLRSNLSTETKAIRAEDVSHLKMTTRIGQLRGVPRFATVIKRMNDIADIEEAERIAARIAAAFSAVIVKGTPDLYDPNGADIDEDGNRQIDIAPGMIIDDLQMGERMESLQSNRPNNEIIPFRAAQLRAAASGIGISYSSLSKDYNGTYSSQRQELVEQHQLYTPLWSYFVAHSEVPKYRRFMQALRAGQMLDLNGVDTTTLFEAVYSQPAMPWIDPQKEATGFVKLLEAKVETRQNIIRQRGRDPRQVFQQIEIEQERFAETPVEAGVEEIEPPNGPIEALADGFYQNSDGLIVQVDAGVPTRQFGSMTDAIRYQQKQKAI